MIPDGQQYDRLRKAAKAYFREFDHLIGPVDYPERRDLREALGIALPTRRELAQDIKRAAFEAKIREMGG